MARPTGRYVSWPRSGRQLILGARILAQAKLQPHRLERYVASNDPAVEEKAADIIGLYVNPPQRGGVLGG